jgi:hypothetical protein
MAYAMWDIGQFAATVWRREFIQAFKNRQSLFTLFNVEPVAPGEAIAKIPLMGGMTANEFTPGAGKQVVLQSGTMSSIALAMDQCFEASTLVDDFQALQTNVDHRAKMAKAMTECLFRKADDKILSICGSYTGLPAGQQVASETPVANPKSKADVATEIENLVTEAQIVLDGTIGVGVGDRRIILPSRLFHNLLMGSDKQSPERPDIVFGAIQGKANPIGGAQPYNAESTSRSYDSYENVTSMKFYVFVPDAISFGLQSTPSLEVARMADYKSWFFSSDILYGVKETLTAGFVECTLKAAGNVWA